MPSSKEYLDFVMEQLSALEGVSTRPMMGEYVLYCGGKAVGGIYDDRLLLKPTKTALRYLRALGGVVQMEIPYEGAKEMLAADVDDRELTCRMIEAIAEDLPEPKRKTGKQGKKTRIRTHKEAQ